MAISIVGFAQLDLEDQVGIGGNLRFLYFPIGHLCWHPELADLANPHAGQALFPALDQLTGSDGDLVGLAMLPGAIEDRAVLEGPT